MKSWIRSLVASPKITYNDTVSDLTYDLAYITPRLIVSSGPVSDPIKKCYRYPIEDLVTILTMKHGDNWHIWNLRGEGKGYSEEDVYGKMSYYPFPDHQPPSFDILLHICMNIHSFLSKDERNVALVHCRAGKGRSGTIICGVLMLEAFINGKAISIDMANDLYTQMRMRPGIGKGVSIRSQLRYLKYWEVYLNSKESMKREIRLANRMGASTVNLSIESITWKGLGYYLGTLTDTLNLDVRIEGYVPVEDSKFGAKKVLFWQLSKGNIDIKMMDGDVKFILNPIVKIPRALDIRIYINQFMYCWFNAYFETLLSNNSIDLSTSEVTDGSVINKTGGHFSALFEEIDGYKGTSHRGKKFFDELEISWSLYSEEVYTD